MTPDSEGEYWKLLVVGTLHDWDGRLETVTIFEGERKMKMVRKVGENRRLQTYTSKCTSKSQNDCCQPLPHFLLKAKQAVYRIGLCSITSVDLNKQLYEPPTYYLSEHRVINTRA